MITKNENAPDNLLSLKKKFVFNCLHIKNVE